MPNLNPRRFSNPDTLNKVKRECLLDWLANATDCGELHRVVEHGSGELAAAAQDGDCPTFALKREDVLTHAVAWELVTSAVRLGLGIEGSGLGKGWFGWEDGG